MGMRQLVCKLWADLVSIVAANGLRRHVRKVVQLPVGQISPCKTPPEHLRDLLASRLHADLPESQNPVAPSTCSSSAV